MSVGMARFPAVAGVVFGVFGTGTYAVDTWVRGDGEPAPPSGFAATCLGIALILVGVGLRRLMRDSMCAPELMGQK